MTAPRLRAKLFADFGQLHLRDPEGDGTLKHAWTTETSADRIADGGDILGIGAADSHDVTVDLEVVDAAPDDDAASWDHVTEASVDIHSGRLAVLGCSDEVKRAKCVQVAPGSWRARISHGGLQKPRERVRIQVWPAPRAAARVVKRWAPPPRPAPKTGPLRSVKRAVAAAQRGETDAALQFLLPKAAKGDFGAAYASAQLLAFQDRWREVVPLALAVVAAPAQAHAECAICLSACGLLRIAAERLDDSTIVDTAHQALDQTSPQQNRVLGEAHEHLRGWVEKTGMKLGSLEKFHELLQDPATRAQYARTPEKLAHHFFGMASLYELHDEALAYWDPRNTLFRFDDALLVAKRLAARGDAVGAWSALEGRLSTWWPVSLWDVAPVVLLIHPALAPLLTAERRALVLSTVRGPEAEGPARSSRVDQRT